MIRYLIFLLTIAAASLIAQDLQKRVHIDLKSRTVVEDLTREIQYATGVPVCFEDAPLAYATDLEDRTAKFTSLDGKTKPKVRMLAPLERTVVADLDVPRSKGQREQAAALLAALPQIEALADYPVKYETQRIGSGLVLLATEGRNASGSFVPAPRPLDHMMSFELADETVSMEKALHQLTEAISKETGVVMGIGTIPINAFVRMHTRINGKNVTARSLLYAALKNASSPYQTSRPEYVWRLTYYQPTKVYFLSIDFAYKRAPSPFGFSLEPIQEAIPQ